MNKSNLKTIKKIAKKMELDDFSKIKKLKNYFKVLDLHVSDYDEEQHTIVIDDIREKVQESGTIVFLSGHDGDENNTLGAVGYNLESAFLWLAQVVQDAQEQKWGQLTALIDKNLTTPYNENIVNKFKLGFMDIYHDENSLEHHEGLRRHILKAAVIGHQLKVGKIEVLEAVNGLSKLLK